MEKILQLYNENYEWPSAIDVSVNVKDYISNVNIFDSKHEWLIKQLEEVSENMQIFVRFAKFAKLFKDKFETVLMSDGNTDVEIVVRYFRIEGYFTAKDNRTWYFNLDDVRTKTEGTLMLRRIATYEHPYGAEEHSISTLNEDSFIERTLSIINNVRK